MLLIDQAGARMINGVEVVCQPADLLSGVLPLLFFRPTCHFFYEELFFLSK